MIDGGGDDAAGDGPVTERAAGVTTEVYTTSPIATKATPNEAT